MGRLPSQHRRGPCAYGAVLHPGATLRSMVRVSSDRSAHYPLHCNTTQPQDQAAIFNLVPQPSSCALTCCSTTPANRSSSSVPCLANLVNCGKIFYNVSVPINETNLNTLLLHDRMQFNSFNELV